MEVLNPKTKKKIKVNGTTFMNITQNKYDYFPHENA